MTSSRIVSPSCQNRTASSMISHQHPLPRQARYPFNPIILKLQFELSQHLNMDMRKLIDDTDFDNINQYSKKWKKDSHNVSKTQSDFDGTSSRIKSQTHHECSRTKAKENIQHQPSSQAPATKEKETDFKKKREVLPQVIDQDTQHFRNRLEHLLNGFKTDAVSEFMSMKKSMLEYQKETIKGDTQKYLTMYEEKHKELLDAKDKLIDLTSDVEKKSMQIELMSAHIAKLNNRLKVNKYLSRPFALLYENKVEEKMMKIKMNEASKHNVRSLKMKSLNGWRNIYREAKKEKEEQINNQRVEIEVKQIVAKFQKQIESLKDKLHEATAKNQEYQASKQLVQQNLKKAFLRGISSMNMEAMGIFGSAQDISQHEQLQSHVLGGMNTGEHSMRSFKEESGSLHPNSSVIMSKSKVQSKDHKWKEAPIMGYAEKEQSEEPRPHLVRPTTEAKVIRVIDGKSAVDTSTQRDKLRKSTQEPVVGNRMQAGKKR